MIKYLNYSITFIEVPDETSICFNITNCPHCCPGCHSPELQQDIGTDLEPDILDIISRYEQGITCICFLGEGNDLDALLRCIDLIRKDYPKLKICLYTGGTFESVSPVANKLDYLKTGPYIAERGGLNNPGTNQRMYFIHDGSADDITSKFWRKKV